MRLKEDSSSWNSSSIKRRNFRQDPGTPETEVSKHTGNRKKKKHVHKYKTVILSQTPIPYEWTSPGGFVFESVRWNIKYQYICEGCGNRTTRIHWPWR